eukprot:CAMPEP_0197888498 /NCGR_PEP_ID=MMETSP1439-20131203/22022_1 /TAXON_ID=66791 /ORGANISM="Gonyaulax spinifera, Strain CCMP409" /LENGTH=157 /DNA_ID=CAMNT_0043508413 /DNA_START=56 /DNA_END=527 /DNA_ORIENTATION=-
MNGALYHRTFVTLPCRTWQALTPSSVEPVWVQAVLDQPALPPHLAEAVLVHLGELVVPMRGALGDATHAYPVPAHVLVYRDGAADADILVDCLHDSRVDLVLLEGLASHPIPVHPATVGREADGVWCMKGPGLRAAMAGRLAGRPAPPPPCPDPLLE